MFERRHYQTTILSKKKQKHSLKERNAQLPLTFSFPITGGIKISLYTHWSIIHSLALRTIDSEKYDKIFLILYVPIITYNVQALQYSLHTTNYLLFYPSLLYRHGILKINCLYKKLMLRFYYK